MRLPIVYLVAAVLLLLGAVVIFRILVRREYRRKGRLTPFSTLFQLLVWGLYLNFPTIYNPSRWPYFWVHDEVVNPTLRAIGSVFIVTGLTVALITMAYLGFGRSFGLKVNSLNQSGPYRLTRNPQIVGGFPVVIGFALRWPSWYALGWVVLCVWIAHLMIVTEEEHLRNVYGEEYVRYCERVPRYLGFPRSSKKAAS